MFPSGLSCFNILQCLLLLSSFKLCTDVSSMKCNFDGLTYSWPVDCLSSPEVHFINCIVSRCRTLRVEAHSDWGFVSLTPLYEIPSLHMISSLKYQYDCVLRGQSLIILGHPSCTIFASNLSARSFDVATHISCSLSGLAGAISVIWWSGIFSILFRFVLQSCGSGFRGATLKSTSAITFSLPQRYSLCTSYWAS